METKFAKMPRNRITGWIWLHKQFWNCYSASAVGRANFPHVPVLYMILPCLQDCTNRPDDDNDVVSVDGDDDEGEDSDR